MVVGPFRPAGTDYPCPTAVKKSGIETTGTHCFANVGGVAARHEEWFDVPLV
jgi:hypothetical protein